MTQEQDIVYRLEHVPTYEDYDYWLICQEAAQTIAALRAERDELSTEHIDMMWQRRRADERAEAADARVKELEAKLEQEEAESLYFAERERDELSTIVSSQRTALDIAIRERDELQKKFDHANTMENFWCDKAKELAGKNDALRVERDEARKAIDVVNTWADQRCPCFNETPNPCPLCGASVENLEACKAAENTMPRHVLEAIRSVRRARSASSNREGGE